MTPTANGIPAGFHTATLYLIVADAARAIEFYKQAFGAVELNRMTDDNGNARNAEIKIGDSPVMIGGHPEVRSGQHSLKNLPPVSVYLYVEDADALFSQAVVAGAKELYPVQEMPYGNREGGLTDPFGIVWWIATCVKEG